MHEAIPPLPHTSSCRAAYLSKGTTLHLFLYQLFIDFKKAYDAVRWEVLYNIVTEFGISMKLFTLIKMYLN
jgi:hypothetical protein